MDQRVKDTDIILNPDGTANWDLLHHGKIGGTYMGTFKFRCYLSPLQMIEQDRDYRELLGPNPSLAGSQHESLAFSLTQLRQRILTHPPFWNDGYSRFGGGHIKDLELLDLVLEAAVETEIKYRKTLEAKHKESIDRIQASLERKAKEEPKAEEEDLED